MTRHFIALIVGRVVAVVLILALGFGVAYLLASSRKPPEQVLAVERPLRVEALLATLEDVPVTITGYGEVRARDTVSIAAEVRGTIVAIHPRLEVGEVIPKGEILFEIDARDYEARVQEASATASTLGRTVERFKQQYAIDEGRLKTLERTRELAQSEYERIKGLYETDQVGTQSNVDQAEMAFNAAYDGANQLSRIVDLFPIRIEEARGRLASATAMARLAEVGLERTVVRAPFDARVKQVSLEVGQYVSPGINLFTLADDSVLELSIPLNSREARNWLQFAERTPGSKTAWFSELKQVPVEIFWTEDSGNNAWMGILHRVERFNQQTRTLTVALRVQGAEVMSVANGDLPLVEGMFCRVRIPGKIAERVVRLPAEAVGFNRDREGVTAKYFTHDNRLELIWTAVPAIVMTILVVQGLIVWNEVMPDVTSDDDYLEIDATGYQFASDIRYPGADNKLGTKNYKLIDLSSNQLRNE
ncbi:MAG: HlyD family efflux transporter periplasmic adaptor subunit [Candidatus Hydrogenedentes bacterium]|nr:HlyD family efflux transporter periplasmic adaptor subunit [Candidatus Hydrogenedentota bacterium]